MILTAENYYSQEANRQYMSVSQFKSFEKCEYLALAELNGTYIRPSSTAMLVGSYVDSHFDSSLDIFKAHHPELFKRDGGLKSEYVRAESIIERLERDEMFMRYMAGQKQVIMTGEIEGIPIKIKMDSYHPKKMIVDLKIMRDFAPIYVPEFGRLNFIEAWRYDLQGAVYQEIVRQNTGDRLPFVIAAATKEDVPDLAIFEVPQPNLDAQLEIFKANAPAYQLIKKGVTEPIRCEHCDACKATKILSRILSWEELQGYGG